MAQLPFKMFPDQIKIFLILIVFKNKRVLYHKLLLINRKFRNRTVVTSGINYSNSKFNPSSRILIHHNKTFLIHSFSPNSFSNNNFNSNSNLDKILINHKISKILQLLKIIASIRQAQIKIYNKNLTFLNLLIINNSINNNNFQQALLVINSLNSNCINSNNNNHRAINYKIMLKKKSY